MVNIQEHTSEKYTPRTYFNAKSGDVTLALAVDLNTAGEKLTHKAAGEKYIGFLLTEESKPIEIAHELYKFMKYKKAKTLNIAGNGIYTLNKYGCDQLHINNFLCDIIELVNQHIKIEKIFTGGQTGVDLAGAVVAQYLNIEALITLPKGYIQRFENKLDIKQSKKDIENQINYWCEQLFKLDTKNKIRLK